MKKFTFLFLSVLMILLSVFSDTKITAEKDNIKPVIKTPTDIVYVEIGSNFDYTKYISVQDNSGKFRVASIGENNINELGEHNIGIIAIDYCGNIERVDLKVMVLSKDEFNKKSRSITYPDNPKQANADFAAMKGDADSNALSIAQNYIGMGGWCTDVAQAFINEFYGPEYSIFQTYDVSYDEARPGDIIYYADGGLGQQHYAVYLGGSTALQGNIYGTTIIGNVYMNMGSNPQFKRISNLNS